MMETPSIVAAEWLKLTIEWTSVGVVGIGFVTLIARMVAAGVHRRPLGFNTARLGLARYLSLALELQLGADIVGTAMSPSWEQIGELAAIAVIRTGLNYFLNREMEEETALAREEDGQAGGSETLVARPARPALVGTEQ